MTQTATQKPVVPRQVPAAKRGISDCIAEIEDALTAIRRSYAGYQHYSEVLAQLTAPAEGRLRGLPIFANTVPDGIKAVEIFNDLALIPPEYRAHVLVPFINLQAGTLSAAVGLLVRSVADMQELLGTLKPDQEL